LRKDAEEVGVMDIDETSFPRDAGGAADAARVQRRKAAFRRRAISGFVGLAIVLALFFWQRSVSAINRCNASLEAYGKAAVARGLDAGPTELIAANWLLIDKDAPYAPSHYHVLATHWTRRPEAGEAIPLACCKSSHGSLSGAGRNVLYRTAQGLVTRWVEESTAASLVPADARSSD